MTLIALLLARTLFQNLKINNKIKSCFRKIIATPLRTFPWRKNVTPYSTLVSEFMLQQTQAKRVVQFYEDFIERFPTLEILAGAHLKSVISMWNGLGYYRRARYLLSCAQSVKKLYGGKIPRDYQSLVALPGIGDYTARAIRCFGFNEWDICIETNIRTIVIHHFIGKNNKPVPDDTLVPYLISLKKHAEMKGVSPRAWYSHMMEYGSYLKAQGISLNAKSIKYTRQSSFHGSNRQVRGEIIRSLIQDKKTKYQLVTSIQTATQVSEEKIGQCLRSLIEEGLIKKKSNQYYL